LLEDSFVPHVSPHEIESFVSAKVKKETLPIQKIVKDRHMISISQ